MAPSETCGLQRSPSLLLFIVAGAPHLQGGEEIVRSGTRGNKCPGPAGRAIPADTLGAVMREGVRSGYRQTQTLGENNMGKANNVLGETLEPCSTAPLTGFTRNGSCETGPQDLGSHTVCAQVTTEFLEYSKSKGNDLITPVPEYDFPGLKPGDRWCLCAARWREALEAGCAPRVVLRATHEGALNLVEMDDLKVHAIDLC
jgi:uncharacterized protein (DUF2237 family)